MGAHVTVTLRNWNMPKGFAGHASAILRQLALSSRLHSLRKAKWEFSDYRHQVCRYQQQPSWHRLL